MVVLLLFIALIIFAGLFSSFVYNVDKKDEEERLPENVGDFKGYPIEPPIKENIPSVVDSSVEKVIELLNLQFEEVTLEDGIIVVRIGPRYYVKDEDKVYNAVINSMKLVEHLLNEMNVSSQSVIRISNLLNINTKLTLTRKEFSNYIEFSNLIEESMGNSNINVTIFIKENVVFGLKKPEDLHPEKSQYIGIAYVSTIKIIAKPLPFEVSREIYKNSDSIHEFLFWSTVSFNEVDLYPKASKLISGLGYVTKDIGKLGEYFSYDKFTKLVKLNSIVDERMEKS